MTRDEEIKLIAECAVTDEKYNEFKEGIIWGAKWADENPKSGTVNKQEFIEKVIEWVKNRDNVEKYLHVRTSLTDNFADALRKYLEE